MNNFLAFIKGISLWHLCFICIISVELCCSKVFHTENKAGILQDTRAFFRVVCFVPGFIFNPHLYNKLWPSPTFCKQSLPPLLLKTKLLCSVTQILSTSICRKEKGFHHIDVKAGYPSVHILKVQKPPIPSPELNPQASFRPSVG